MSSDISCIIQADPSTLSGSISANENLTGEFQEIAGLQGEVQSKELQLSGTYSAEACLFGEYSLDVQCVEGTLTIPKNPESYDGVYQVTPKANIEQTLQTADKLLSQDIVVKKIPYYETANVSGKTVYIGSEV